MSHTLTKRGREAEALLDSVDAGEPKRFHFGETDPRLDLLKLDKTLSDDDGEECSPNEELLNRVMRSLEEEIATRNSTSSRPSNSADNSAVDDISSGQTRDSDSGQDLCYLLEASDDALGIPPMPAMDFMYEVCQSSEKTSDGLSKSADLQSLRENWYLEDDFENCQQFVVFEDAWNAKQLQDYLNQNFVSHGMLFEGDFSVTWRVETASKM